MSDTNGARSTREEQQGKNDRNINKVIAFAVGLLSIIIGGYMIIAIQSFDSTLFGSGIALYGIGAIAIYRWV